MKKLNCSGQEINVWPTLSSYKEIVYIDISSTNITELPEWIYDLTELEVLNIHDTRITHIDSRIGCLKSLKKIDISGTQIKQLPKDIRKLNNLMELYAYDMELVESDFDEIFPDNLIRLDISNTKIHQIPSNVYKMKKLKLLNISKTETEKLAGEIENLVDLEMLNISRTKISRLPVQIGNLQNLQTISASFSRLEALPFEIGNAISLRKIMIDYTQVMSLPDVFSNLNQLQLLNLSGLCLDYIPQSLVNLSLEFIWSEKRYIENGIVMSDTVLSRMPLSILLQNKKLLNDYYNSQKTTFNEGKVILLGNGDVGKSYIVDRIINNGEKLEKKYEPSVTRGISIKRWECVNNEKNIKINIWDFGGQEIIHSLHRMFLTERTLYLIVLNARYDTLQDEAEKWLKTVESFAPRSNVILIVNKMDLNEFASINETILYEKFSNLKAIKKISAKYDDKPVFDEVVELIIESCKVGICGIQIPMAWNCIRLELSKISEKHILKNTYRNICKKYGVDDINIQNWILEWFRDIGVCFIVNVDDISFKNRIILDSQWVLNFIYKIIYIGKKEKENGFLNINKLCDFFDNSEEEYSGFSMTLGIMRQFLISFNLNYQKEFIPILLEKNEKIDEIVWCNKAPYILECRYTYLPVTLFHQIYLKLYSKINMIDYWYSGIFFKYCNTSIDVCIKINGYTIQMYIYDLESLSVQTVRELLGEITELSKNMNLKYENYVGIKENGLIDYFSFERIRIMLEHNKSKDFSHVLEREIDLIKLNGCLPRNIELKEEKAETEKIFVFYQYYRNVGQVNNYEGGTKAEEKEQIDVMSDINEIVQEMRKNIIRAEEDEKYELELKKINYGNYEFKKFISYVNNHKWDEFYKKYISLLKTHMCEDKRNKLVDVLKINFSLGIAIWKYYKILILTEDSTPFFFFLPLDTQFFPIAIVINEEELLFNTEKFISYLKKNAVFNDVKGGEYKDILLIQGILQQEINITKEYIHYK